MNEEVDPSTFLSGRSGHVAGIRRRVWRSAADAAIDALARARRTGATLDALAARVPERDVLVLGIYRPGDDLAAAEMAQLRAGRHRVHALLGSTGAAHPALQDVTMATGMSGGKFQNLNTLLASAPEPTAEWTLLIDDDVVLPERFLDRFLGLCEHFDLALAQPAQTLMSHAAWPITRRRPAALLRETRFVEIGPVTAFRRDAAQELMPFPDLRFGWGLELHWAAVAGRRGWRLGIADAVAVRHERSPVASGYSHAEAVDEGGRFLAGRPYVHAGAVHRSLAVHRRIGGR